MLTFQTDIAGFRFRNNDGTEVTASYDSTLNQADYSLAVNTLKRLRLLVQETNGGAANNEGFTWQYRHVEGTNTWTNITTTSSVVKAVASLLVDDADTTSGTHDLGGTGTFIVDNNAQCEDGVTTVASADFIGNDHVDCELSFEIVGTDVSNADTIDFRVLIGGAAPTTTTNLPTLTVSKASNFPFDANTTTYSVSGADYLTTAARLLKAETQTYSVTGGDANLNKIVQYDMDAETQSYLVTTVNADFNFTADFAATTTPYLVTGGDANLIKQYTLQAETQTYAISTVDSLIVTLWTADANHFTVDEDIAGQHTADGYHFHAPTDVTLQVDTQSYLVTGVDVDLSASRLLEAETQTYSVTGVDAGLSSAGEYPANTTPYLVTGGDASLNRSLIYPADTTSYNVTGGEAGLIRSLSMDAETVSYSVTGGDADLNKSFSLLAETQSYLVSQVDVNLVYTKPLLVMEAETANYYVNFLGFTQYDLTVNRLLEAETDALSVTTVDANFNVLEAYPANTTVYNVTGGDASFVRSLSMDAETASYGITGGDAELNTAVSMDAETQTYLVATVDANLNYNVPTDRRIFIVT